MKTLKAMVFLAVFGFLGVAFAQDTAPAPVDVGFFVALLQGLVIKYPVITSIVSLVGAARLLLKPIFSFLHTATALTKSTSDDLLLEKVEGSKVTKAVLFVLDYLLSVKVVNPAVSASASLAAKTLSAVVSSSASLAASAASAGASGVSGYCGTGFSGGPKPGSSGISGSSGASGHSGTSGGTSGHSGTSGASGHSG